MASVELPSGADLEQLGEVVERLPIGVIMFDTASARIVFANSAVRALLKRSKIRLRGPIPDPWASFSLPRYAQRLVEGRLCPEARVHVDDDCTYLVSGVPARGMRSAAILIEDISLQERRSRAQREFAANAAHELLTPLTGIISAAHVLEAGAKELPEERDRFVAHISHECARLARTARSLLVLARAQSGEETPKRETHVLRPLLDEVADAFITDVAIHCDKSLTVRTEAELFLQAAINLVGNAIRHGSGAGVVIEARSSGEERAQIDILDTAATGAGSAVEHRGRFQTGEPDSGGFGLGLSIAEQSLDAVGGRLELREGRARIEVPRGGSST